MYNSKHSIVNRNLGGTQSCSELFANVTWNKMFICSNKIIRFFQKRFVFGERFAGRRESGIKGRDNPFHKGILSTVV